MNALTKALDRSAVLVSSAHDRALRMKASGLMDSFATPAVALHGGDWTASARSREALLQFRSWVYAAVSALGNRAGGQPMHVGRVKGKGKGKAGPGKPRRDWELTSKMTPALARKFSQEGVEQVADHPLLAAMEHPNQLQWRSQFVFSFVASLNLTGRGYVVVDSGKKGDTRYFSLPASWVREDRSKWPEVKYHVGNPGTIGAKTVDLGPEQVARAVMPDPANPLGALAPAASQAPAIRIDDRVQTCQEKFFDNSVNPSVIVTIGKEPLAGLPGGSRPRLSGVQRRQVETAIRKVLGGVANFGSPAIVDGLIESIAPFGRAQNEIGWEKSEERVRDRILSAFAVHPFILGIAMSVGGYAQAWQIYRIFNDRVNVFLDLLGLIMTELARRVYEDESLVVWWEAAEDKDPQLWTSNLFKARASGDITRDELRAALGFPPAEDLPEAPVSPAQVTAITGLLEKVGGGSIAPEQAEALLVATGVPQKDAKKMAGEGPPEKPPQPAAPAPFGQPPKPGPGEPKKPPETEEEAVGEAAEALREASAALRLDARKELERIERELGLDLKEFEGIEEPDDDDDEEEAAP